jgi:hypothetical protein
MIDITLELSGDGTGAVEAIKELLQAEELKPNQRAEIADGVSLTYFVPPVEGAKERGGLTYDNAFALSVLVSLAEGVASSIAATYICSKLKPKAKERHLRLKLNKRTTEFEKGEITRIIDEEIRLKK